MEVRFYGKKSSLVEAPLLTDTQVKSYEDFLQADIPPEYRKKDGLQAIFEEIFPIEGYDKNVTLDFIEYKIGEPWHTLEECRHLGLTYASPMKIRVRLKRPAETLEEEVYLCDIPRMLGGGEFVINGSERVIVTQIQRSPGVDFNMEVHASGKHLHTCRIIPERGSWITIEVTTRDSMCIRIDRSGKIPATTFLRALSPKYSTNADILREFYPTEKIKLAAKNARQKVVDHIVIHDIVEPKTGEVLVDCGELISSNSFAMAKDAGIEEIEIITQVNDELVLRTLREDDSTSHDDALLKIYLRLRPGNPMQMDKAVELFEERFRDPNRYNFGRLGRFRINRKFGLNISEEDVTLRVEDFVTIMRYFNKLRAKEGELDDIDHLGNRRVRTIKDLVGDEFRKGLIKLRRSIRERLSMNDKENMPPRKIVNSQTVQAAVQYFFARGELSQVVDQSNLLSQLTHERRLSALGPGGLNRKRAGFEVRDVHPSHYGRICPIETPEGTNIGLIVQMSIFASVNEYGFLVTPYAKVEKGRLTDKIVYMRADEEAKFRIAQCNVERDAQGRLTKDTVTVRYEEDFRIASRDEVDFVDVAPNQLVGVAASLIPFLEHDDANRALMGANMQRQAVPLMTVEPPVVATGVEKVVPRNSSMVVVAREPGVVVSADSKKIVLTSESGIDQEYELQKYMGLNERTCLNQKPVVMPGQKVTTGQVIADGAATKYGELSLGKNILVAFMSWEGYNFEDSLLVSESLLRDDKYTSIHIEEFQIEVRETKLGKEEITRDIPNVSDDLLRNLDEDGLIFIGTHVKPGDILVGKVSPKSKTELSSEEKLLRAIFGRAGEDVKNDSLEVKPGCKGVVIDVRRFRKSPPPEDEKGEQDKLAKKIAREYDAKIQDAIKIKLRALHAIVGKKIRNVRTRVDISESKDYTPQDLKAWQEESHYRDIDLEGAARQKRKFIETFLQHDRIIEKLQLEKERKLNKIKRGDELQAGVLELVKIYVAVKNVLQVGDKMAGRHGNKGVIGRVLAEEDMPFLADGTPVEMVLNPLGVPSRMNLGQILETHLGWAAKKLNFQAITPVFDGVPEEEIRKSLAEAGLPTSGKSILYDGRTGDSFDQEVTVGYMYMLKLHHLVVDKIHARATGPYSLITQQPLGGKARYGGQRFGEMEVWALEAYGAANILQELLTVKSDDVEGRTKIYESMVKGENILEAGTPLSFEVLANEIRGLALNLKMEKFRDAVKS